MWLFWIVAASIVLFAATIPSHGSTSVSTYCYHSALYDAIVSDEDAKTEYAIVTATITDKREADGRPHTYKDFILCTLYHFC